MKKLSIIFGMVFLVALISVFCGSSAFAGIPHLINYQGMLTDNSGTPLTDTVNIIFKIYDNSSGGNLKWQETQINVPVINGLFNVLLGSVTPIDTLSFSQQYWLDITLDGEQMPSRLKFTSTGYAYRSEKAQKSDTASVAMSAPSGGGWTDAGTKIYLTTSSDSVGIGTATPRDKLHVYGTNGAFIRIDGNSGISGLSITEADSARWILFYRTWQSNNLIIRDEKWLADVMTFQSCTGRIGIGTSNPEERLHVAGGVKCSVLKLTGGSDIAEPFDVKKCDVVKPGMVLAIDPENPGKLKLSEKAYDRSVAGIISGAGGIEPGMLMGQSGSAADGEYPVAMTGRVYCWADASKGSIEPGDLLTTSDTPGYAMKVTDHAKAQGAVIGKAMSSLQKGRGLILVLVSLQ